MASFRSYSRVSFDRLNLSGGNLMVFLREEIVSTLFLEENQPMANADDKTLAAETFERVIIYC